ncbi:hypothetical protein [Streptacidiphilus rugosus]|uniref:hypothetical protein n=1 Tax=Streptacidiphilus rugosus TaxID=405783 RepID=UPI00055C8B0D|nr:hypothetical protein [Streptacidiphilus rugosus]
MRRELVQGAAWAAATGAAVCVSWYGVHRVLADDGYHQPTALALSVAGSGSSRTPAPPPPAIGDPTQVPAPSATRHGPSPSPGRSHPGGAAPTSAAPTSGTPSASADASASASGDVSSYTPEGGRVAVSMGASSASLVSATPDSGWSMHVWSGDEWLRVDFTSGTVDSAFYVTWNGHPPMVSTWIGTQAQ